jgi:D-glycero-D-manno-heptose 1,7-bisphosphate phosphatase
MSNRKKAIFLDRDGVLNKLIFRNGKAQAPYTLEEFELFPGVEQACKKFKDHHFLIIVVTNQPDVARGWVNKDSVELINKKISEQIHIDEIKICFHVNADNCECRKPMPGMLLEAADHWNINLLESFMIGDRYSDISAGIKAGCKTILIGPGDEKGDFPDPHYSADSLIESVDFILKHC